MRSYKKIPIWENKRRIRELNTFRQDLQLWIDSIVSDDMGDHFETDPAIRSHINRAVDEVGMIVRTGGVSPVLMWTPPPAIGGYSHNIDLITNFFNLDRYLVPHSRAIDFVERAIGNYERDQKRAKWRTFNPLFWVVMLLDYVASLPFVLLRQVGFNVEGVESSWVGRLVRFVVYVLGAGASLVTILGYLSDR